MSRILTTCLLSALLLAAQTNRGGIGGSVTDQSQAVVPGVSITITNIGTNEARKLKTSCWRTCGYKLYQLRNAYVTNFDTLYNNNTPRYLQFGVKLYF